MDKWEAKQAYIDKLMNDNENCTTLTEEQHAVLRELCGWRHRLHCIRFENCPEECAELNVFWNDGIVDNQLAEDIECAGLPELEMIFDETVPLPDVNA